jgi:hypothetical protein
MAVVSAATARSLLLPNQISPAASADTSGYADRAGSGNRSATISNMATPTAATPGNAARHRGAERPRTATVRTAPTPPSRATTCTTSSV